jgi:hypothetical protein
MELSEVHPMRSTFLRFFVIFIFGLFSNFTMAADFSPKKFWYDGPDLHMSLDVPIDQIRRGDWIKVRAPNRIRYEIRLYSGIKTGYAIRFKQTKSDGSTWYLYFHITVVGEEPAPSEEVSRGAQFEESCKNESQAVQPV